MSDNGDPTMPDFRTGAEEFFRAERHRKASGYFDLDAQETKADTSDIVDWYGQFSGDFPFDKLDPMIRNVTAHYASKHGLPRHVMLIHLLTVIGASVKHRLSIRSVDDKITAPNLYVLGCLPSAFGKTGFLEDLLKPSRASYRKRREDFEEHDLPIIEARIARNKLTKHRFETGRNGVNEENYKEAVRLLRRLEKEKNSVSSGIHGDITEESLVREMAADCGWAFCATDEASKMFRIIEGMYAAGKDRVGGEVFTKAFTGGHLDASRVTNNFKVQIPRALCACLWLTQPDELARIGRIERLFGSGFMGRFITVVYTGQISLYAQRNGCINLQHEDAYHGFIAALEQYFLTLRETGEEMDEYKLAERGPGVEAFWKSKFDENRVEASLATSRTSPFLLRCTEIGIKIALILHLIRHDVACLHVPLEMEIAEQGYALAKWYSTATAKVFEETDSTADFDRATKLVTILRNVDGREVPFRTLQKKLGWSVGDFNQVVESWKHQSLFAIVTKSSGAKNGQKEKFFVLQANDEKLFRLLLINRPRNG